ncbi:MAG: hypothetical protein ABUM26_05055 [Solirubrobacterales bacterium]
MSARQLIDMLCVPLGQRASAWSSKRDDEHHRTRHAGFAGYPFSDEGYEFMERLVGPDGSYLAPTAGQIIRAVPEAGDWPYVIFMWSPSERAVIQYCEGDLMVDIYDTEELCRQAVRDAIAEHPCP